MTLRRHPGIVVAALASIGMATAVIAQTSSSASSSASTSGMHHHHGGGARGQGMGPAGAPGSMLLGSTLRATRELNLTENQKSQIKTILKNAHQQAMTEGNRPDMAVLGDPSNPGYSAALQSLKTETANRIQHESEVQGQIVNVLTPEQKAKLPTVLASIKQKHEARSTASAERHSSGTVR